ncbi:MAG: protein kinase [Phycisphaeraceae bacterium]|nr:protein kinase [Phycisphaeraceae bacterium]
MSPERTPGDRGFDEKAVFLAALRLSGAEREAYLSHACPDAAARARIETLLRHHAEASETFMVGEAPSPPATATALPAMISHFRIIRRIGAGGMGTVYLAEDTVLARRVALKVLAPHLTQSPMAVARFEEEARHAARLRHPAIVPVFEVGVDGANHYIVSEFVDGPTLAEVIAEEARRRESTASTQDLRAWHRRAAEIAATIADALEASHRDRTIHRDVKPSNILMDPERGPRLTDFGIARQLAEGGTAAAQTALVGSCHYMSPEQASVADATIDWRSDIFSLGVVLYEMLALRRPFDGRNPHQVLQAVIATDPPRLRSIDRTIHVDLETICHVALEKNPERRYQSAAHVAADLRCALERRPILARPPGRIRRIREWIRHRPRTAATAVVVPLVLTIALLASLLVAHRHATMAWFAVESEVAGASVRVRTMHEGGPGAPGRVLRSMVAPIRRHALPPGQYRITVSSPDGAGFAEFNAVLLTPGREHMTTIVVLDGGPGDRAARNQPVGRAGIGAPQASSGAAPTRLVGRLLPTARVVQAPMVLVTPPPGTPAIAPFHLDPHEVSNAAYLAFMNASGHRAPRHWTEGRIAEDLLERPVVGITMQDAEAFARWHGKRLPTRREWQAALAWGDTFDARPDGTRSAPTAPGPVDLDGLPAAYARWTLDVRSPDPRARHPELRHMRGNVRELTGSVDEQLHASAVCGPGWTDPPDMAPDRAVWMQPLGTYSLRHGFRCAKSVHPDPADTAE